MFRNFVSVSLSRICQACLLPAITTVILSFAASAAAGETVAVGLASGRIFAGEVDPRTDDAHLWLRSEGPGVTLCRPIEWDRIVLARIKNTNLTANQLRAAADSLKSSPHEGSSEQNPVALPPPPIPHGLDESAVAPASQENPENLPLPRQWAPDRRLANYIQASRARDIQVSSVSIDACVANWNQTVETDGIVLHLYPLDDTGCVVPVDGTLDVEVIAAVPEGSPLGVPFPQIARWSVRVTPDQFGPAGAVYKLPFQAPHPEFDLNIGPQGLVHARLNVPGNGSFETSRSMVRLRQYSQVRDLNQQINGERFFNIERVDRWGR